MNDTQWLTADEAALHCQKLGLNRSKKTMRRWAQQGEVEAKKQTMQKGMRWLIDQTSLETKIAEELEFQEQQAARAQSAAISGHSLAMSASERSQADKGGHDRSQPDTKRPWADLGQDNELRSLRTQIQTLSVDVGWRDQMLDKLTRENEALQNNLHGQARYIGHLESDLMRLGGEPDTRFLTPPTSSNQPELERP